MNFTINDFNGPLDLLLHLIKANKMDIYNINIAVITKEYLDFINNNSDLSIDAYSEYLVMASELIHLKSKLLLNNKVDEEEDTLYDINNEEELRMRLLEYQSIKEKSDDFRKLEAKRSNVYTKIPANLAEFKTENQKLSGDVSLADLINAFEELLKRQKMKQPINTKIAKRELSVEERISSIRDILKKRGKINFVDLFDDFSKPYVIVTFLGILDMSKNKEIIITQERNFGQINIEGRM